MNFWLVCFLFFCVFVGVFFFVFVFFAYFLNEELISCLDHFHIDCNTAFLHYQMKVITDFLKGDGGKRTF